MFILKYITLETVLSEEFACDSARWVTEMPSEHIFFLAVETRDVRIGGRRRVMKTGLRRREESVAL